MFTHANLILNENKHVFRVSSILFFGEIISQQGVSPYPGKIHVLKDMPSLKTKERTAVILGYTK